MERDRDILPVEPIARLVRVKPVGAVRLFKRPGYRPKLKDKKNLSLSEQRSDEDEQPDKVVNHAHHVPEKIGERVDFKI